VCGLYVCVEVEVEVRGTARAKPANWD